MTWNMDDPKWTAYVLGELDEHDRAELELVLGESAEARAYVASLRDTIGTIERELAAQPPPAALDELQRKRIEKAAAPRSRRVWWVTAGVAASAAAVAMVAMATVRTSDEVADKHARYVVQNKDGVEEPSSRLEALNRELQTSEGRVAMRTEVAAVKASPARLKNVVQQQKQQGWGDAVAYDHGTEAYSRIDDNPFFTTAKDPLSTFSIDVDTASYANLRRFLGDGQRPPKDAVRIEEMINYFHYDYAPPAGADPFSITTEVGPAPWNPKHQLVRVGLRAPAIDDAQVPARNLVFLIDVSGSMQPPTKLPLLRQSLGLLVEQLRPEDKVAIVVYAGAAGLVLPPTRGNEKEPIRRALASLEAGGSTAGAAGIQLAYEVAGRSFIKGGINRVILCSDGDYNVGPSSEGELTRLIETERQRGVFLTVLGFGMGNLKDATMEKLADRGNGNYAYIDSIAEARKVLVEQAGATLVTVAKDVKLQVELNPAKVAGYRLIGYENRVLAHRDFNDDTKDAGDIGAGHTVTALYELVPAGSEVPGGKVDDLKYQTRTAPSDAARRDELMTIKVRYKAPDGAKSQLLSRPVAASSAIAELAQTTVDFRWAAAIAGFGMLLRDSPHRGNLSWSQVHALAESALGRDTQGYRRQAVSLILDASRLPPSSP